MKEFTNKKISKDCDKKVKLNKWIETSESEDSNDEIYEKFKNKI